MPIFYKVPAGLGESNDNRFRAGNHSVSSWIKFRTSLVRDGRVRIVSRTCHVSSVTAIGALVTLWSLADELANEEGEIPGYTSDDIDEILSIPGFCKSLPADWIELSGEWVKLPKYLEHNGTSAKSRALAQQRQNKKRSGETCHADVTMLSRPDRDQRRGEEIRLDNKSTLSKESGTPIPDSPNPDKEEAVHNPEPAYTRPGRKRLGTTEKPPLPEKAPVLPNCEFFRASDAQISQARKSWQLAGNKPDDFNLAIREVDLWLQGETAGALKARKASAHTRHIHAAWVIENLAQRKKATLQESRKLSAKEKSDLAMAELARQCAEMDAEDERKKLEVRQ